MRIYKVAIALGSFTADIWRNKTSTLEIMQKKIVLFVSAIILTFGIKAQQTDDFPQENANVIKNEQSINDTGNENPVNSIDSGVSFAPDPDPEPSCEMLYNLVADGPIWYEPRFVPDGRFFTCRQAFGVNTDPVNDMFAVDGSSRFEGYIIVEGDSQFRMPAEFRSDIQVNGNVTGKFRIGNTSPTASSPHYNYKLSVDGKAIFKEAVVTLDNWADFVFDKEYKLKPLNEVEDFIQKNNHLPDVPSEKEILENGVNVGEMDAILLQKIEELTLYMIELNKENNTLKQEISDLKYRK